MPFFSKFGLKLFISRVEVGQVPIFVERSWGSLVEKLSLLSPLYQTFFSSFKVQRKFRMSAQGKEFNPNELEAAFEGQLW